MIDFVKLSEFHESQLLHTLSMNIIAPGASYVKESVPNLVSRMLCCVNHYGHSRALEQSRINCMRNLESGSEKTALRMKEIWMSSVETLETSSRSPALVFSRDGQNRSRCSRVPSNCECAQAGRRQEPDLFSVQCL